MVVYMYVSICVCVCDRPTRISGHAGLLIHPPLYIHVYTLANPICRATTHPVGEHMYTDPKCITCFAFDTKGTPIRDIS